jgi:hypothetical protein
MFATPAFVGFGMVGGIFLAMAAGARYQARTNKHVPWPSKGTSLEEWNRRSHHTGTAMFGIGIVAIGVAAIAGIVRLFS